MMVIVMMVYRWLYKHGDEEHGVDEHGDDDHSYDDHGDDDHGDVDQLQGDPGVPLWLLGHQHWFQDRLGGSLRTIEDNFSFKKSSKLVLSVYHFMFYVYLFLVVFSLHIAQLHVLCMYFSWTEI